MGTLEIIIVISLAVVLYIIKSYQEIINDHNKRQPMQTITQLRHHHWLMKTGMREHADNFNGFGLRRTIRRKKGRRGII